MILVRLTILVALMFLPLLPATADDPVSEDPAPAQQEPAAEETADKAPKLPPELPLATIPLRENLRFTLRPTILGLIPPDSAEDYGEGLVRVSERSGNRITLHYEIKEEIEKQRGGDEMYELQEAPIETRTEYLTRFRRGDAVVDNYQSGRRIACPLFWQDGDFRASDYGLMWIPAGLLETLKDEGSCDWQMDFTTGAKSDMASELEQLVEARRKGNGIADGTAARLELIREEGRYIVPVNGAMSQLAAVHARDSWGVAEYWFLDDPDNPLLLKMSFIASPDASPAEEGIIRQLQAGIGFAITSLNY